MNNNDKLKIKNITMQDVQSVLSETEISLLLNEYDGRLTIDNQNVFSVFLQVYCIASENVCDKTVINFLKDIDDLSVAEELAENEFLELASRQKKITVFKSKIKALLKARKAQQKSAERIRKAEQQQILRENHPPYYQTKITQNTVEQILSENSINVRLNLVTKKIEVHGFGADKLFAQYSKDNILVTLPTMILDICKSNEVSGISTGVKIINTYLFNIADANRYNPIHHMLEDYKNNSPEHLDNIYKILGLDDEFDRTLVKKWLIQTVALAFNSYENPISTEGVLILQGAQAVGKTTFFRKLACEPLWFVEGAVIDTRNKDTMITATSGWICELGEIDSTFKKEQSALKAFITRTIDKIRLPYAPVDSDIPRTTSLCGTVNPENFLKDTTGNRRYWTIHVDNIDKHKLNSMTQEEVFNLWGYVYTLYLEDKNGFRLSDVELARLNINNREYQSTLPYEEEIRNLLKFEMPTEEWEWYSPADIAEYFPRATAKDIGYILSKIEEEEKDVMKFRTYTGYKYKLPINQTRLYSGMNNCYK